MINDALDVATLAPLLAARGRLQIADYLQEEAANFLFEVLDREVPWTLAVHDAAADRSHGLPRDQWQALDASARATFLRDQAEAARGHYGFAYETYQMVQNYLDRRDADLPLHRIVEFLNSPDYIGFMQALTGDRTIRRVNAQATCYRPGEFLKNHSDIDTKEGRRYAYVINLSRGWQADWGGLLHFTDAAGSVVETFVPRWNSLSLFRVPTDHHVSLVAPWAENPRYAITGWLMS